MLHLWAAIGSVPLGVALVALADGTRARVSLLLFAIGATLMLGISALVHDREWSVDRVETMVRLDHTAIFLTFATTVTPVAVLGLDPPVSGWLLGLVWVGAVLGVVIEWLPIHPPTGVVNGLYLTLGWSMVVFLPWLVTSLTLAQLGLLLAGGVAYTLGAVVVGARRPDPWTDIFGYHEIWHVFVVLAVLCHAAMAASLGW